MIFHFPWGLVALLSLPAILALHFFRSRKEVRRVGGLQLWDFARQRPPVGARWDRLVRSASLLCQLLAAMIVSLLLAGVDLPRQSTSRHYAVILDDSLSMTAGAPESAAARAEAALLAWAGPQDRFTLIAAGVRPRLLCEPFSSRRDMASSLFRWRPAAPACDLPAASCLAAKFLEGDEKTLCFTDHVAAATAWDAVLELWGVGQTLENNAIVFADRVRVAPGRDRILLRLQRYADAPADVQLTALAAGQPFHHESVTLPPDRPVALSFETAGIDAAITLRLPDDPLAADNLAVLAPVVVKPVRVACVAPGRLPEYVQRAVDAVHDTFYLTTPEEADLLFVAGGTAETRARHVCRIPIPPTAEDARLVQGQDLLVDHADARVADLPLEGLLWAYWPDLLERSGAPLIECGSQSLLVASQPRPGGCDYALNLVWNRTNLFRHTAWPVLVQAMIEACRQDLPGMDRTNFRMGETVRLQLEGGGSGDWTLLCDGAVVRTFPQLPDALAELEPGLYEFAHAGATAARFAVNLPATEESDLRPLASREADTTKLIPSVVRETETNRRLFFALVALLITLTGLSWAFQDISR